MFRPDGRLYGCRNGAKQVAAWDKSGKMSVVAEGVPKRFPLLGT